MPSLAAPPARALALLLCLAPLAPALAQATLSHLADAAPVPTGMLRLRVANVWTRYDERFAPAGGTAPLGAELSADSLGTSQFPRLQALEAGLRTLALDPSLRLSLGRLRVGSNARIVTTPIAIEYGLTRRLSIGVSIPIVQTRRVAQASVTGDSTLANVGYVPVGQRTAAAAANQLVATAFQRAADSLGRLLTNCPGNPAASGCAAVNANPADATASRLRAQQFADAIRAFGVTAAATIVAPRQSSDLADTIEMRRTQLNLRLRQYLGATAGSTTSLFTASTDFSYVNLQGRGNDPGFLASALGGGLDSIRTTERIGFGDISVGAQFMVFDRFHRGASPAPRLQSRLAIGAAVRLPTSRVDSARNLVDIPTGDGAGVELRSAWDLIVGHFGATVGARYAKSLPRRVDAPLFGDPESPFPFPAFGPRERTAGDIMGLDVTPRLLLTETLAIDGHYGIERVGATRYDAHEIIFIPPAACTSCEPPLPVTVSGEARTAQRLGLGVRYSTVDAHARGTQRLPVEVAFTHLATVSGSAGLAKQSRDQIQVRLFYQLRRPR